MDSEDYYFIGLILGLYPIFYFILKRLFGNSIIFRIAFTFVTVDVEISISCFIIGGMGSLWGAFFGALILGLLNSFGVMLVPDFEIVLVFLLMVVVLMVRPWGLLGRPEQH